MTTTKTPVRRRFARFVLLAAVVVAGATLIGVGEFAAHATFGLLIEPLIHALLGLAE